MKVIAIIVTHNPEPTRFVSVLKSVANQVSNVIIVDNNSHNKDLIRALCNEMKTHCKLIELRSNTGIAYALKIGIRYAYTRYEPD